MAEVTAIFKKGSKQDPGNYRPVSLTCITCKVLEALVRDSLVAYFNDNNLYSDCQHGFRQKRSCMTQLLEVMNDFTKQIDEGSAIDVVYLDFRKAFDSVSHKRLLIKLAAYGITGSVLNWIQGFLSNRHQKVRVGSDCSQNERVLSGIPQGSILGPVLFTIFINDLPECVESTCKIFADDTKVYNITDNNDVIQNDLSNLQSWSQTWKLLFNVQKCKVMHVGKKNPRTKYYMGSADVTDPISVGDEEKDLGVIFDNSLTFDVHIQKAISKANQMVGIIKRSFSYLDKEIFLKLYKAMVRPHLEYGNLIWHPYLKRQSVAIERVQRRATKILSECKQLPYGERLKYLELPSLKSRRLRNDLIETFKIFHGYNNVDFDKFFTLNVNKTRNKEGKLFYDRFRTNIRKNYFTNRVVQHWNNLHSRIKFAPNLNVFKNLLDKTDKNFIKQIYDFDE